MVMEKYPKASVLSDFITVPSLVVIFTSCFAKGFPFLVMVPKMFPAKVNAGITIKIKKSIFLIFMAVFLWNPKGTLFYCSLFIVRPLRG